MSDDEVDRAIEAVDRHHDSGAVALIRVDDVYPWWTKLRIPFILIGCTLFLMGGSVAALVVDDVLDDRAAEHQQEQDDCRALWVNRAAQTAALTRLTSGTLDNMFNSALLDLSETGESTADTAELRRTIETNAKALGLDRQTTQDWQDWERKGEPLPCPIQASDSFIPGDLLAIETSVP